MLEFSSFSLFYSTEGRPRTGWAAQKACGEKAERKWPQEQGGGRENMAAQKEASTRMTRLVRPRQDLEVSSGGEDRGGDLGGRGYFSGLRSQPRCGDVRKRS